jgi:HEAT repeat protein
MLLFSVHIATAEAQPTPDAQGNAGKLAQGWMAFAQGDVARASRVATEILKAEPRSISALSLAVEVEITRTGALGALTAYEAWLGIRRVEAPYVVRRIAHAVLRDLARQGDNPAARREALRGLREEGDFVAASDASADSFADELSLASAGNQRAIESLLTRLKADTPGRATIITALGESQSRLAGPVLMDALSSTRDEERAAAADALGKLGFKESVAKLRPLVQDPNFTVRLMAAGALYRLGDDTGLPVLRQIAASEYPGVRVAAAEALSSHPDQAWLQMVRELTNDGDPTVRLKAARLLAEQDPNRAKEVLDQLMANENPAVREDAGRALAQHVASDFTALRALLRSADQVARAGAARRILALTR